MRNEDLPHLPGVPGETPEAQPDEPNAGFEEAAPRNVLLPEVVAQPEVQGDLAAESGQELDGEGAELRTMTREYREVLGDDVEVIRLGEAGYMVRIGKRPTNKFGDWVLYDLDDTLLGYSEAKTVRQQHYEKYLFDQKIALSPADAKTLLDITDKLARWDEQGRETYHIDAHINVLARLTDMAGRLAPENYAAWVSNLKTEMTQAITNRPTATPDSLPFYFSGNEVIVKADTPGADREAGLYNTVFDAMIRPERYQDVLDASTLIEQETAGESYGINQGILTYGEPAFQLRKTLELLRTEYENGNELPMSTIFLSSVVKGKFLAELLKYDPVADPEVPATSAPAALFSEAAHVILLVDDSPTEIESFLSADEEGYGEVRPGLGVAVVRYAHEGTKNFKKEWQTPDQPAVNRGIHYPSNPWVHGLRGVIYNTLLEAEVLPRTRQGVPGEWSANHNKRTFYETATEARARHQWLYADAGSDYALRKLEAAYERTRSKWRRFEERQKVDH